MFVLRKHLLLAATFVASLTLLACNSTDSDSSEEGDGPGGNAAMTYDGLSWQQGVGICPGTDDYISTFAMTSGDISRVLYIQTKTFPAAGSFTVWGGANDPDSLSAGEVGVSLVSTDFNFVNATGGTVTVTRPSASSVRFEGTSIPFDNGKTATFTVTATMACNET